MTDRELLRQVGQRVLQLRTLRKMTQREVARDAKVDLTTVSRIERGVGDTTLRRTAAIARALGVRLTDLIAEEPLPELVALSDLRAKLAEVEAMAREALRLAGKARSNS